MEQISDDQITNPIVTPESRDDVTESDNTGEELLNEFRYFLPDVEDDTQGLEQPLNELELDHEPNQDDDDDDDDAGSEEPLDEEEDGYEPYVDDSIGWAEPEYDHESSSKYDGRRWDEPPPYEPHYVPESFDQDYLCLPIDKNHLEDGNKVIMPASALGRLMLMDLKIEYPMLFQIKNHYSDGVSHCGVLEFSSEEGFVLLPNWMMKHMKILEGDLVNLRNVSLPKGDYIKIQPHETKFVMDIKNPKDVLEAALKDYTCVSVGDTIIITYEGKKYMIDIVETKPSNAISLIETDCEVDFATPLDYKEPEKKLGKKKIEVEEVEDVQDKRLEGEGKMFQAFTGKKYTF